MTEELDKFVEAGERAREELETKKRKIKDLKEKAEYELMKSMTKLKMSPSVPTKPATISHRSQPNK